MSVVTGWVEPDVDDLTAERGLGLRYRRRMDQDTKDAILVLVEEGVGPADIARQLGIPEKWVHDRKYHLRRQRKLPDRQSRPKDEYRLADRLWAEGKTIREIADAYGYTLKRMCGVIDWYRKTFGWFPKRYRSN